MTGRRSVTIMLHRDGDLESRSIRLPLWLARFIVIGGSTLLVLIVLAAILYAPMARTAARVPGLTSEVERLRAENEMVHELVSRLEEVESQYDQVRTMLGGDVVAVRGRALSDDPVAHALLARTFPEWRKAQGRVRRKLGADRSDRLVRALAEAVDTLA